MAAENEKSDTNKQQLEDGSRVNGKENGLDASGGQQEPKLADDEEEKPETSSNGDNKDGKSDKPPGGFDPTPIPPAPPGYTLKITIHRATNLPMADISSLSSDPYVLAQLYSFNPTRNQDDPPLKMRTFTVRRNVNPEWNAEWIVANVPAKGFKLKCRIYDEDSADHDDRLGNAHIDVSSLDENWPGIKEKSFRVKKRMGSKRAYLTQALAAGVKIRKHMGADLTVSVEMLGRTESQHGARVYTVGPMWWTKHYSPLLGRMTGKKTPAKGDDEPEEKKVTKTERYNFQANQFQLEGPVPAELYHRYVEFSPFVKRMFTSSGISGFFLHKALYHQHQQIYHFDNSTESGYIPEGPSKESTLKFLDLVHYDTGGRIFTYIITLDGLFRFTETGKEFGIDMLSKHTMHSDVSVYIAFSGEFFVRRLKHKNRDPPELGGNNESHPPNDIGGGPPGDEPPKDPAYYELIIDNDSGTYRPNAELLSKLKEFLEHNLPGLTIVTLDCQEDAEIQQKMKAEQRERKKIEGDSIVYRQGGGSSISSSDDSDLDHMAAGGKRSNTGVFDTIKRDLSRRSRMKKKHWKTMAKGRDQLKAPTTNGAGHASVKSKEAVTNGTGKAGRNDEVLLNGADTGAKGGPWEDTNATAKGLPGGDATVVTASI